MSAATGAHCAPSPNNTHTNRFPIKPITQRFGFLAIYKDTVIFSSYIKRKAAAVQQAKKQSRNKINNVGESETPNPGCQRGNVYLLVGANEIPAFSTGNRSQPQRKLLIDRG